MERNECIRYAVEFFKIPQERIPNSIEDLVTEMDEAGVETSVILGQDVRSSSKSEFKNYTLPNEESKKIVDKHPDRFIAFGSVDPRKDDALAKLKTMALDYGFEGLKIHCDASEIYPNDPSSIRSMKSASSTASWSCTTPALPDLVTAR